jgi:hypothetical protein
VDPEPTTPDLAATRAYVRARVALSEAAAFAADALRDLVTTAGEKDEYIPGDFTSRGRAVRSVALAVLHRCVVADRARGATWEQIADAYGMSVDSVEEIYAVDYGLFLEGIDVEPGVPVGMSPPVPAASTDPVQAAADLDRWHLAAAPHRPHVTGQRKGAHHPVSDGLPGLRTGDLLRGHWPGSDRAAEGGVP